MHSHNYTLAETRRRFTGEGSADAAIFPDSALPASWARAVLLPWAAEARLRPDSPPRPEIVAARRDEVRQAILDSWRWLEGRRSGREPASWTAYAAAGGLFPRSTLPAAPLNLARHLRLLRARGLRPVGCLREHPMTRPVRAIPALLAREHGPVVAHLVGGGTTWSEQAARCLALWRLC